MFLKIEYQFKRLCQSNSLDPDQAQHFVGPDLVPNFLKKLSADGTIRKKSELYKERYR